MTPAGILTVLLLMRGVGPAPDEAISPQGAVRPAPARSPTGGSSRGGRFEIGVAGVLSGTASFGDLNANLTAPDGTPFVLFRTSTSYAPGAGAEALLSVRVAGPVVAEVSGSWRRASLRTRVTGDAEGAPDVTLTDPSSRYDVQASAVVILGHSAKTAWFLRAGGGWLRQLSGEGVLAADGAIANAGGGVKYWWRNRPATRLQRVGVRIDGRVEILTRGLPVGDTSPRVVPEASAALVVGF